MTSPLRIQVFRGTQVESEHRVLVCAVDLQNKIVLSAGDVQFPVYLRSSAKPFQALAFLESGAAQAVAATSQEVALACASHLGLDVHVQTVQNFLKRVGIDSKFLQNHAHEKNDEAPYACQDSPHDVLPILKHNCSGKHAAFLATQKHLGGDLKEYLQPNSPTQKLVFEILGDLTETAPHELARSCQPDGCGAPIFTLPLLKFAKLYAELGARQHVRHADSLSAVFAAMRDHPELVRGEGDFNTDLIRAFDGRLVAKLGYEGVYGLALGNGVGIAIKVLDGNGRALAPAVMTVLAKLFSENDSAVVALQKWREPVVYNVHHVAVGRIQAHKGDL